MKNLIKIAEPIGILGGGVEGISTAEYLLRKNYTRIEILDKNIITNIPKGTTRTNGENYLENLSRFKTIFRSPGFRPDIKELNTARASGTYITSAVSYFLQECPCKVIGITGTAGKGTACSIAAAALQESGFTVHLGGNIGTNPLDFLDNINKNHITILEISSFQAMDMEYSPHICTVLKTTSEHLNWHTDVEEYKIAKAQMVKNQSPDDIFIFNGDSKGAVEISKYSKGQKFEYSLNHQVENGIYLKDSSLHLCLNNTVNNIDITEKNTLLKGKFNLENISAAILIAVHCGAKLDSVINSVKKFKGLQHRLEYVTTQNNIDFYNDSYATRPDATIAAINSFNQPLALILGGSEKYADFSQLASNLLKHPSLKSVQLIGQTAERLKSEISLSGTPDFEINIFEDFKEAIEYSFNSIKKYSGNNGVVLLSPSCASFGMFENYKQRGLIFKDLVLGLNKQ
ncbi:MAG: UDP-N-acetylmuramoyl-L-alanine--D-glutamate ligase [Deltaproteobacteria bacterium]|nr:UDP-N-acetylmuramoyl-L-alanine--D-glutamate ligase [Deltaproteobacteria bacterium]